MTYDHHVKQFNAIPDTIVLSDGCFVPNYAKPGIKKRVAIEVDKMYFDADPPRSGMDWILKANRYPLAFST